MSDARRKRYSGALKSRNENGESGFRSQSGHQTHNYRGRNNNAHAGSYRDGGTRMNTSDRVKKIVQEEGRTARNLIIYNVPLQERSQEQNDRSRPRKTRINSGKDSKDPDLKSTRKSVSELTKSPKSDVGKKPDLRARYWKFLFDNLQRAVDAIYETCEQDESALECREVIMMLQQSTRDFQSLIERLHVQKEFEIAFKDGDRPSSIAWEVRKMSPGKSPSGLGHHTSPSPAQRVLTFTKPNIQPQTQTKTSSPQQNGPSGNSWADKVKGIAGSPTSSVSSREVTPLKEPHPVLPEPPVLSPVPSSITDDSYRENEESEDSDGWETVQRGHSKSKPWGSPSQRSLENLSTTSSNEHYKLTRSVSEPDAAYQNCKKYSNSKTRNLRQSPDKNVVNNSNGDLGSEEQRHRTDSEKENKPNSMKTSSLSSLGSANNLRPNVSPNQKKTGYSKTAKQGSAQNKIKPDSSIDSKTSQTISKLRTETSKESVMSYSQSLAKPKIKKSPDLIKKPSSVDSNSTEKLPQKVKDSVSTKTKVSAVTANRLTARKVTKSPIQKGEDKVTAKPDCDKVLKKEVKVEDLNVSVDSDQTDNQASVDHDVDSEEKQIDDALACAIDQQSELEELLSVELEKEQDKALETAIQEEETWLKELAREENTVIDVETETEDSELGNTMSSLETSTPGPLDWDSLVEEYDAAEKSGCKKDWGEMAEEADARTPGHAVLMHEKLLSPSRKRSPTESKKRHEEKQAKAQELRDRLMQEKSERLRDLGKKVEEVRSLKEELIRQKKEMIERKMQQAEEKRLNMLKSKSQKAHDEEKKANEIAFINTLVNQNKRLDIMSKHQESEARLQDIQDERQRKHEEKLAKEAEVEERRRTLQAERLARLHDIQERRKIKDARIEQHMQVKESERQEALRAKEKDREERLAALNAQHEQHLQELQKKIQQKQDESSQRHMEALKQIREKAFEMSVLQHSTEDHNEAPQITPYESRKICTICNALIASEVYLLSHLRGKTHQQALKHNNNGHAMSKPEIESFNLKHIVNAPDNTTHPKIVSEKERIKSLRKRCKKLKQRMNARGLEYENSILGKQTVVESENKAKMQKVVRDINKYLQSQESGPWSQSRVTALDRALGELNRIFDKKIAADQASFRQLGALVTISRIIQLVDVSNIQTPQPIPQKSLVLACQVFRQACKGNYDNCHYMMFSNKFGLLVEVAIYQLTLLLPTDQITPSGAVSLNEPPKLPYNLLAINILQLLSAILSCLAKNCPSTKSSEASMERMSKTVDAFTSRGNDIISYIISVGIVDKLTQYLRMVQGPIDDNKEAAEFIQHSLGLLVALTKFLSNRKTAIFEKKKCEDPTQLISTFEVTECVGIVSLLYGMLLHSGTPSRGDTAPPEFPQHTLAVATTGLRMLNHMATLELEMMQTTLGQEGTSLEFRHIASYLIWYCSHHSAEELLHELILCVGYFAVKNTDNQMVIQSGQPPTVFQQMCSLPFMYFSDPRLVNILFPTLISCCYNNQANREIMEQELSCVLLSNFIEEKQLEAQQQQLVSSTTKKSTDKEKREVKEGDVRVTLASRFPTEQWTAAQEYFKVT